MAKDSTKEDLKPDEVQMDETPKADEVQENKKGNEPSSPDLSKANESGQALRKFAKFKKGK